MARTVTNPNKFKFLDYVGLQELVNKIKGLIDDSKAAALIETVTYDSSSRKFTLTQGTKTIDSDAIVEVSASNSGLMTPTQLETLNNVNAEKVQRICVSVDGSNVANTLRYDTTSTNNKLAIIDYTTNLDNRDTEKQAPTAGAVKIALDKKVNTEDYNKDKTTFALETSVQQRFEALPNTYYTEAEINNIVTGINKAITDGDALKVNSADFNTYTSAQQTKDENQDAAIKALQDFVGVANTTSTNVYNKTEVDTAINNAKKDILLGDATGNIAEAYDTIKEIADWITTDATGATGLTSQVAANTDAIATNKGNIETNAADIVSLKAKDLAIDGEIEDLKEADNALDLRVGALEETVGNATKGLVKDVADLKETVGDATKGLVKAVSELQAADESLDNRIGVIENNYASKSSAVGSLGEIKLNATTGNYEMQVKSVSETLLQTVIFETFTTTDIEDLFK